MNFDEFENLVKDALANMYDFAAMETHPLINAGIIPEETYKGSKGDFLRGVLLDCIQSFKPIGIEYDLYSNEWRAYNILHQRYVENISTQDLAKMLLLGERQIRRSQKKAVQAVTTQLWDRLSIEKQEQSSHLPQAEFVIHLELVNLDQVLNGIVKLLNSRFEQEEVEVSFTPSEKPNFVFSDRIILRQILIGILNLLLQKDDLNQLQINIQECEESVCLGITAPNLQLEKNHVITHLIDQENSVTHWAKELNLIFNEFNAEESFHFEIIFAKQEKKLILIVDDQEPALRMYQRYLSKSNYKIYGLSKATKVLSKAVELKPSLILLDIMMPKVDGWEILQSLRLNDKTKHIPIIVCSAWGEPELAKSLGANHFLRKPIVQKELLDILESIIKE